MATEKDEKEEKKAEKKRRKAERKKKHRGLRIFVRIQIILMVLVLLALGWYYLGGYAEKVAELRSQAVSLVGSADENTFKQAQTSIAYDSNGAVIAVFKGEKDVYYIGIEEIPEYVKQAIISIEDKKFYTHHGFDFSAIVRAVFAMIQNGKVTQGASTITQQLARNTFLTNDVTWQRKVEEIYIAVELEKKFTKDQILEFYLNNIYFANGYYGIQAASRGYFNKDVSDLSLSQIAYLCAIPNGPTKFDPVAHPENTLERRDRILQNMLDDGVISLASYENAMAEEVVLERPVGEKHDYAETFTQYCTTRVLMKQDGFEFMSDFDNDQDRREYEAAYDEAYAKANRKLFTGGYRIYTSLDFNIQNGLQGALDAGLNFSQEIGEDGVFELQGSAVCIDNSTGLVKAIVGGRSQDLPGYTLNRAYQSYRQPGSAIKPLLVYTPMLERGLTPDTIVYDVETEDGPKNADGVFAGEMTLRRAVELSKNTVAWNLYQILTPKKAFSYLKEMGFYGLDESDEVPAASIGGFAHGVSSLEMARGYATLENDGNCRDSSCIMKITDPEGNEVYTADLTETVIYKESAAREMTDILKGVMINGTAKGKALPGMPCAGKTGTTTDNKDGWFCGYTPYYTTAVWVGYDTPRKVERLTGATYPLDIWYNFMAPLNADLPVRDFLPPTAVNESLGAEREFSELEETTPPEEEEVIEEPGPGMPEIQPMPGPPTAPEIPAAPEAPVPGSPEEPDTGGMPAIEYEGE